MTAAELRKGPMKKVIAAACVIAALGATATVAEASYQKPKQCDDGGWNATSKLRAPTGTTCATARNVLDKWMASAGPFGDSKVRVGRDGVLWRCTGSRAPGRLNPWYIFCYSSQKTWHYNAEYDFAWYSTKSMWFNYRTK